MLKNGKFKQIQHCDMYIRATEQGEVIIDF